MGEAFAPYAGPVFERCLNLARSSLIAYQAYQQNPDLYEPDRTFLVYAPSLRSSSRVPCKT